MFYRFRGFQRIYKFVILDDWNKRYELNKLTDEFDSI
jgi:hypothetical protein